MSHQAAIIRHFIHDGTYAHETARRRVPRVFSPRRLQRRRRIAGGGFHAPIFATVVAVAATFASTSFRPRLRERSPEVEGGTQGGHGERRWVANRDADNLTVFDAATGAVVRTFLVGDGAHDIAISETAGKAYVTNELEDRVAVVSTSTLQILRTLSMPRPHHAKVSADGRKVYVGLFNNNLVAAIDTATDQVHISLSSLNPNVKAHAPRSSPSGRIVFVPHEVGDEVTALDAATGQLLGSVNIGSMPTEVLPAADGRRLFVAMRGEGRIKVVDLATIQVTGSVDVGTQPESMILANDQRTLISSLRGSPAQLAFATRPPRAARARALRWQRDIRRPRRPAGWRYVRPGMRYHGGAG
jgi:outer membrane protein assembly factor BamB